MVWVTMLLVYGIVMFSVLQYGYEFFWQWLIEIALWGILAFKALARPCNSSNRERRVDLPSNLNTFSCCFTDLQKKLRSRVLIKRMELVPAVLITHLSSHLKVANLNFALTRPPHTSGLQNSNIILESSDGIPSPQKFVLRLYPDDAHALVVFNGLKTHENELFWLQFLEKEKPV